MLQPHTRFCTSQGIGQARARAQHLAPHAVNMQPMLWVARRPHGSRSAPCDFSMKASMGLSIRAMAARHAYRCGSGPAAAPARRPRRLSAGRAQKQPRTCLPAGWLDGLQHLPRCATRFCPPAWRHSRAHPAPLARAAHQRGCRGRVGRRLGRPGGRAARPRPRHRCGLAWVLGEPLRRV